MASDAPRYVASADGTRIGYLKEGSGPGVVLVQGAMADVTAYRNFATALSGSFTVYSAERRGRGISPKDYDPRHDVARDVEDIDAILAETGATAVFGLSSGAIITLEAARALERVTVAALYEPPFYADGIPTKGVQRLFDEVERGDLAPALIDSLLAAGTAPPIIRRAPRPIAVLAARLILTIDDRSRARRTTFRQLLPGVRFDFHDVREVDGRMAEYSTLDKPMLLLSGTASPAFLRQAIRDLRRVLPNSEHVEFDGLGHDGPWNDGKPERVATALTRFMLAHP